METGWSSDERAEAGRPAWTAVAHRLPKAVEPLRVCISQAEDLQFSGSSLKHGQPPKMEAPLA